MFQKTITDKKKDTCRIVFGWRTSEAHSPLLDWMIKGGYTWGVELLHDVFPITSCFKAVNIRIVSIAVILDSELIFFSISF